MPIEKFNPHDFDKRTVIQDKMNEIIEEVNKLSWNQAMKTVVEESDAKRQSVKTEIEAHFKTFIAKCHQLQLPEPNALVIPSAMAKYLGVKDGDDLCSVYKVFYQVEG
jgi:hypothetical protein